MDPKKRAGEAALSWVEDGMVVGLGTGSTAKFFIEALGLSIRDGKLKNIRGVPTSTYSEKLARDSGINLVDFDQTDQIDVTIDGADEIAPDLNLIKGLGGALLREKLVAQNSKKLIIIADAGKVVSVLGSKCPLPVEVTIFGHDASRKFLANLGAQPTLRRDAKGGTFITDNGNWIYDCRFTSIANPVELDRRLSARAGIVESGLFISLATAAIVADANSVNTISRKN